MEFLAYHNEIKSRVVKKSEKNLNEYLYLFIVQRDLSGGVLRTWINRDFILAKKSVKEKYFFELTFTDVHMGRQKVSKADFQSQFSMSKIIWIFLSFFFHWRISVLKKVFLLLSSFENFNFWTTLFSKMVPNFWRSVWTSVKVKSKNYFYFTDFFAKIYSLLTHVRESPPLRSH